MNKQDQDPVNQSSGSSLENGRKEVQVKWYRSTFYNALILGICNFLAPGIWGAMNSLGAGGEEKPYLVNAANGISFSLMVLSCYLSSALTHFFGIKWVLIIGSAGYAPYAAGLYTNNRFGTDWFVIFGSVCCGLGAGFFWMAEAAIALAYPEPHNKGRFLGFWLSFRLGGQVLGGAINLGLDANRAEAGSVSYTVYLIFIVLQVLGPFAGLLLNKPSQVQRKDGLAVQLSVDHKPAFELAATAKLFFTKRFLLIVPFIAQAVYTEAVMFTFQSLWFSVRVRALGSFLSGIVAITSGNILGAYIDNSKVSLKLRARYTFIAVSIMQGSWFVWATVLVTRFHKTQPTYDWVDPAFGSPFACFLFLVIGFQLQYMFLYFIVGNLAQNHEEVVRLAALLRGTESAAQAISYGLDSISIFAQVGGFYLNFGLWGLALLPAWLIVRKIGVEYRGIQEEQDSAEEEEPRQANDGKVEVPPKEI